MSEFGRRHHDMGGLGAGPVEAGNEHDYAYWEKKIDAVRRLLADEKRNLFTVDEMRRGIEELGAKAYDEMSYYERWITSLADMLVEADLVSLAEIANGRAGPGEKQTPPLTADAVPVMIKNGRPSARELDISARFQVGAAVRTNTDNPTGHTRLPRYARGRTGEIVICHGAHVFPDASAHGGGDAPRR